MLGTPTPVALGSSPLTRGKLGSVHGGHVAVGLIPAHAGKTPGDGADQVREGAHPRSRGENRVGEGEVAHSEGSSPLTRGKLRFRVGLDAVMGLIPAHAGKTQAVAR